MIRCLLAGCALAWAIVLSGCHMGEHPYDYCGPVWAEGRSVNCNPDYRAGSVLSGPVGTQPGTSADTPPAAEQIQITPAAEPIPPAEPTPAKPAA
jgi:hypothetical protein